MIQRDELTYYLNTLLSVDQFTDFCPNGLQVEGKPEINKIVTGVTACQAFLDAAIVRQADAVIVHHGYFWKNEPAVLTGIKRQRLATLLAQQLNLFAYHLPLDAHLTYGNNVQLAKMLDLQVTDCIDVNQTPNLLFFGTLLKKMSGEAFSQHIQEVLNRQPLYIAGENKDIGKVAWCTGAAPSFIQQALLRDVDAYITGEPSESVVHIARESRIHFYAAGHHATERYGVQALGKHLQEHFTLEHEFIDIANPV